MSHISKGGFFETYFKTTKISIFFDVIKFGEKFFRIKINLEFEFFGTISVQSQISSSSSLDNEEVP